jgi:hypothetical protein
MSEFGALLEIELTSLTAEVTRSVRLRSLVAMLACSMIAEAILTKNVLVVVCVIKVSKSLS